MNKGRKNNQHMQRPQPSIVGPKGLKPAFSCMQYAYPYFKSQAQQLLVQTLRQWHSYCKKLKSYELNAVIVIWEMQWGTEVPCFIKTDYLFPCIYL